MQLQRYFDGSCQPIAPHIEDIVETVTGERLRRGDALVDSRGAYHADQESVDCAEEEYYEERAERVHEFIDGACAAAAEYTEHDDYGDSYAYVALECVDTKRIADDIAEYITDLEWALTDDEIVTIAREIAESFDDCDVECEHYNSEYAAWSGDGVAVESFPIGEIEEQLDVDGLEVFEGIDGDELERILEDYRGDAYLYRFSRYNRETGKTEYNRYVDRGTLTFIANPGGAWHYYIPGSYIRERINDYLEACED